MIKIIAPQPPEGELSTIEKMYYMARPQPIDFVEGADGVWRQKRLRGWDDARRYGHMAYSFDYFTKYAGIEWPHYGIWIDRSMI